ncbi:hypothetical protein GQX73_g3624 [Xylaria multiplex]|uniref:Uncharacterized protein n=1 Tax=Xylaria multiplex TaxID=323545 RepID=A0A7C8IQT4_9PEZI|nr:hypothetical protein GQX73_g3624 [Xylaria multiplex]
MDLSLHQHQPKKETTTATDRSNLSYGKGRNEKQVIAWEHEHLSLDSCQEILKKPYTDKFDTLLLYILNQWGITLDTILVLEKEGSTVSRYWPYALKGLKHVITRCYDCIWRDHMRFREVFSFSASRIDDIERDVIDDRGRGVIKTDVALSRVATVELICAGFGLWTRDIYAGKDGLDKFSGRGASFNFDFVKMDLEWTVIDNEIIRRIQAKLPFRMLFPETESSQNSLLPNK